MLFAWGRLMASQFSSCHWCLGYSRLCFNVEIGSPRTGGESQAGDGAGRSDQLLRKNVFHSLGNDFRWHSAPHCFAQCLYCTCPVPATLPCFESHIFGKLGSFSRPLQKLTSDPLLACQLRRQMERGGSQLESYSLMTDLLFPSRPSWLFFYF